MVTDARADFQALSVEAVRHGQVTLQLEPEIWRGLPREQFLRIYREMREAEGWR